MKNREQLELDALLQWVQREVTVTSVSFDVHLSEETLQSVREDAYAKAIANARRLAASMATASGFRLSQLLFIEQGSSREQGNYTRTLESASRYGAQVRAQQQQRDEPTNIISVNASVNMKFLLDPIAQ